MRFAIPGAVAAVLFAAAAQADSPVAMDNPIMVSGIETVCTGIAETRDDPRWNAYPVRIEFADKAAHLVIGARVTLANAAGAKLSEFDCQGAVVLFKLAPGPYKVTAVIGPHDGGTATAAFSSPAKGQKKLTLRFFGPDTD